MKNKKRVLIIIGCLLLGMVLLLVINFVPTMKLKTTGMKMFEGEWVNVYYEEEYTAALDVFELADKEAKNLSAKLGFEEKQEVSIYIYDSQEVMQTKKYGYIASLLNLDWYIGDYIGTDVTLTSPANPGSMHNYDTVKNAVLHEMVHAYITILNPKIPIWLTDGVALYLTNGEPFYKAYLEYMKIPSYSDTKTINPIHFSNIGGYTFAHTYIEYLDKEYGWDKLMELICTEDYQDIFHKTEEQIYEEWVTYLLHYYQ